MAGFARKSAARFRHQMAAAIIAVPLCFSTEQAPAEIVLDDFDALAKVVSPEMEDEFAVTENVGDLLATRRIGIAAGQTDVIGTLDAGHTAPSTLTAILNGHVPASNASRPLFSYQFNYEFSPSDISEAGKNNLIIFDFLSINGTEPPLFFQFGLWDSTHSNTIFLGRIDDLPLGVDAFSLAFPFSSFTIRDGSPGLPDFSTVYRLVFSTFS